MKNNTYNKNAESHKEMNQKHAHKGMDHMQKGAESKSHKESMEDERTRRPQTKRGGRHCPNC